MNIKTFSLFLTIVSFFGWSSVFADVNVLIIGSTKDSGERHHRNVSWNDEKPPFISDSEPFSPTEIRNQLQNILQQDNRGTVNVTMKERHARHYMASIRWQAYSYNLATWFHFPFPAGVETNRWADLRGEEGTAWDYVVLIGDPYTMEHTPGLYAQGVAKIAEEVAKGPAEVILLMPWKRKGSLTTAEHDQSFLHYKEVVYRTARSGGFKVAPAGLAWQASELPAGSSHPTTPGAYISAASIYSAMNNQSAAASDYSYNDTSAETAYTTYTTSTTATSHYSGVFSFQNPYLILDDKRRDVHMSQRGTSTENGFSSKIRSAMARSKVTHNENSYNRKYSSNTPEDDGRGWPTANPMPIAFNYGRDGIYSEDYKSYVVNPSYWQAGFGYYYHNGTYHLPAEEENDLHMGLMQAQDNDLANRMINEAPSARNIPIRTLWAQIHQAYPTLRALRDNSGPHLNRDLDEAVGTYMYTIYSGRCPLNPEPAIDAPNRAHLIWTCRKIGYETAWRLGRCQSRAPGFKVSPSAGNKKSVTPSSPETMKVEFILPPNNDVTVTVSLSNSSAAIVGPKTLVFTPENYRVPQEVTVAGIPGALGSEDFEVQFLTTSADEVYDGLSDSWSYTSERTSTLAVTQIDNGTTQISVTDQQPKTINLNVLGANSGNTIFAGPGNGTIEWVSDAVIEYTPGANFTGIDQIAYVVTINDIQTIGCFDITESDKSPLYTAWSSGTFNQPFIENNPNDNQDGDSLSNLQEFAFGTDPTKNDYTLLALDGSAHGTPALVSDNDGITFHLYFVRRKDFATSGSITYTPQFSSDLGSFTPNTATPTLIANSALDPAYEIVRIPFPNSQNFGRIKIDETE